MNSNVHPLVAALVLALTAIAIGIWMWGSGAAANIGGPSEIRSDANGHVFVQMQSYLVEHDADGQFVATHDLRDMGVELFLGSFAFFSNGDILLRRGPDPRSLTDNLRAFQRKTNQQSIRPDTPESGLFRCTLASKHCSRFGHVDFKAAHGIAIDPQTDEVYVADTTRHVLRKYSEDGIEIAGPVEGFKFPNQILLHDDKLFVADTNHHEVRIVSPETATFGKELSRYNVTPPLATEARQTWPSHLARVGDQWWLNNMRNGMNQGGIYLFDESWQLVRRLNLPDGADPIALTTVDDEVWVSDWYNDKVRRISKTGELLPDLESKGLEAIVLQSRIDRRAYELIGYSGVILFALVLGGLLMRGFAVGMTTDESSKKTPRELEETHTPLHLEPDDKLLRKQKISLRIVALLMLLFGGALIYIIGFKVAGAMSVELILVVVGSAVLSALLTWVGRANSGTSISVKDNFVTLKDHSGRESTCPITEIRYDDTAIATPNAVVFLGRPMASVYKKEEIKELLLPRIANARKVSALTMQKILIDLRHPQGLVTVFSLIALVAYTVWILVV